MPAPRKCGRPGILLTGFGNTLYVSPKLIYSILFAVNTCLHCDCLGFLLIWLLCVYCHIVPKHVIGVINVYYLVNVLSFQHHAMKLLLLFQCSKFLTESHQPYE